MADSWYLMSDNTGYDQYPDEEGIGGFQDALDSMMSCEVELCNYDLSQRQTIKAIIEHKQQDTELQTLERLCYTEIGLCKAGMYIHYKNRYWLIVGIVEDNGIYDKSILRICHYPLTWMDETGKVHQRWAYLETATQYNNGESGYTYYYRRTDKLLVYIPNDEASLFIPHNHRFIVDKRREIYEREIPVDCEFYGGKPLRVYRMTRQDNALYDYGDGQGVLVVILYLDEQRANDGNYLINGERYWLCDPYQKGTTDQPTQTKHCVIEYDSDVLFNGLDYSSFEAVFMDGENDVEAIPVWTVTGDEEKLQQRISGSEILLRSDDNTLVGKTITLSLADESGEYEPAEIEITIKDFM